MFRVLFAASAVCFVAAAGCASNPGDETDVVGDSASDLTARTPLNVAALQDKNWVVTTSAFHDGDILALRLYADGSYVRLRCYGAGCAKAVPETDRFTAFRSKGKKYIEFESFVRVLVPPPPPPKAVPGGPPPKPAAAPEYENKPVVADTYELVEVGGEIKLRKTYGARWTRLGAVDDAGLCSASGGTWSPAAPLPPQVPKVPPTTKGQQPAQPPPAGAVAVPPPVAAPDPGAACRCATTGDSFVGGAAGCIHVAAAGEDACDSSNGSYTDDDATKLGTYCACGLGRTLADTGCVDL